MNLNKESQKLEDYKFDLENIQSMPTKSLTNSTNNYLETTIRLNDVGKNVDLYYSDYDPLLGLRIAASLAGLMVLFFLFLIYKIHCNAKKAKQILTLTKLKSCKKKVIYK